VQTESAAKPVAEEEEEQGAVLGEHVSSKPKPKATRTASAPAATTQQAPVVQAAAAGEQLPFTGLDSGLVALMGAGLLGTGVLLRRRTQPTA
jgi:hypothetical protein